MPRRFVKQVVGEIYHVYNRSIAGQPIFTASRECDRFISLIDFYRFEKPTLRFSHYNRLSLDNKKEFISTLYKSGAELAEVYAFSLMPNHFHFLLKQKAAGGIAVILRNIQNAYAKYFNKKNERSGSLFQLMFKAVRIGNDEQFMHVARYIHLNPVTSYDLNDVDELTDYKWSSFADYMGERKNSFVKTKLLLGMHRSRDRMKQFTLDQVDYQRKLGRIKHLGFD